MTEIPVPTLTSWQILTLKKPSWLILWLIWLKEMQKLSKTLDWNCFILVSKQSILKEQNSQIFYHNDHNIVACSLFQSTLMCMLIISLEPDFWKNTFLTRNLWFLKLVELLLMSTFNLERKLNLENMRLKSVPLLDIQMVCTNFDLLLKAILYWLLVVTDFYCHQVVCLTSKLQQGNYELLFSSITVHNFYWKINIFSVKSTFLK